MRMTGLAALAAVAACAHAQRQVAREAELGEGNYRLVQIRSPTNIGGEERLVELGAQAVPVEDATGEAHQLAASGELDMLGAGRCRLQVRVSVDGEPSTAGEKACSWRVVGDELVLGGASGLDGGAHSVFRIAGAGSQIVLEGLYEESADGQRRDRRGLERIVMERRD